MFTKIKGKYTHADINTVNIFKILYVCVKIKILKEQVEYCGIHIQYQECLIAKRKERIMSNNMQRPFNSKERSNDVGESCRYCI